MAGHAEKRVIRERDFRLTSLMPTSTFRIKASKGGLDHSAGRGEFNQRYLSSLTVELEHAMAIDTDPVCVIDQMSSVYCAVVMQELPL